MHLLKRLTILATGVLISSLVPGCVRTAGTPELPAAAKAEPAPATYQIRPKDKVRVTILGRPDLNVTQRVTSDGKLTIGWIGDVEASGQTETELAEAIEARFADGYLKDPHVTVSVTAYGELVYITGEVNSPGAYPYRPQLTVLQALALAGGASKGAAVKKVRVLRVTASGARQEVTRLKPADLLEPDDVVIVPERFF